MRRAAILVAFAAAACGPRGGTPAADTTGSSAATAASASENGRAAVDSMRSAWGAGAEKKDSAAVAALYSDDAVLQIAGAPLTRGRENIEKALGGAFGMTSNLKINSEGVDVGGDIAVDHGSYTEHVAPPGGKAMDIEGRYIVVLKSTNGSWKIVNHMGWLPPAK